MIGKAHETCRKIPGKWKLFRHKSKSEARLKRKQGATQIQFSIRLRNFPKLQTKNHAALLNFPTRSDVQISFEKIYSGNSISLRKILSIGKSNCDGTFLYHI